MNCNNCTNNNALKEVKIKHVHGNVLRMAIPLTLRTIELVDGEINATDTPFVPSSEHPVKVVFSKGSVSVALDATMKDGNIAYIEEKGKIPVGTYAITVTCNDDNGNPYRFKQNAVLYVADATIEAGIEETIEYEVTTWYLDAAIFLALKGEDGVGIYDIETQSSGEIGGVNTVTFILTDGRTRSFNILNGSGAVDSDLDINSPSPIANSAVTARFNELSGELADLFGDVDYDTSSKSIRFWDKGKTNVLASLDARPFIKDGMVSNAYISNNTLVITFNTDSGKEAIGVPLTSVFNPNNYYTKTQVDSRIASAVANINLSNYYTKAQVDAKLSQKVNLDATTGRVDASQATRVVLDYIVGIYDGEDEPSHDVNAGDVWYDNGQIHYAYNNDVTVVIISLGAPQKDIIYCNAENNKLYRWNGSEFVQVGGSGSGSGGYEPPVGGIPKSDLAQSVQDTLDDVSNKVDNVAGKGLSTEDYTTAEKQKLAGLSNYDDTEIQAEVDAKYEKPSTGIPKTDLAPAVQASLGKADTALQSSDLEGYATTDDVDDAVAALISSAPQTLDTLKELADALGDDPNFATTMATQLGNKVDKETGKGLSTNDYTTAEKNKLAGLENYDDSALQTAIDGKVDKESGKSLMTDAEHTKLAGIDPSTYATKSEVNAKQDTINDLDAIRSGAALGATALQSFTETDPTVPSWAKADTKPTYTAQEVGALPASTTIPSKTSDLTNDSGFIDKAMYYGESTTAAATMPKVCTVETFPTTTSGNVTHAKEGTIIAVKFTNSDTNTTAAPELNVNGIGAKAIMYNNAIVTSTAKNTTVAGTAKMLAYYRYNPELDEGNGAWEFLAKSVDSNSTYSNASLGQGYATQSNSAAATAITASISSYALSAGGIVTIKFTYDVPANATLNINSKGAKAIYNQGAAITAGVIKAGDTATFIYSTYYYLLSVDSWQDKQDAISDLATIRSGAAAGATAAQPADIPTKVSDLTNDSGFTSNAGTITGITMNGVSKGTSGVVDLGTVITEHQSLSAYATTAAMNTALAGKQDVLTFDNAPTAGSNNPVKSGGIKTALDAKANTADVPTKTEMADAIDDALGEAQVTVVPQGSVGVISSLGSDSNSDALSASMGKKLKVAVLTILNSLGNYAFPDGKPTIDWGDDTPVTFTVSKTIGTGLSATGGDTDVEMGDNLEVTIAITDNLYIIDDNSMVVTMGGQPVAGAWNSSTMKVTIAAVTGNVVINVPSMTYVDVDGSNNQLAFFLDCKNRGGQTGHWIDLIGNKDFTLTDVTEADDGMVFNGSTSKGVASGSLDVYYYNNTYGSATIEAVVDMSSFTPASNQRLPILANTLDGRVAASFRTTGLGVQIIGCSTSTTGVDDPNNNTGFFFTKNNKSFGATGGTDGGIVVVDGVEPEYPRVEELVEGWSDVHDFGAGLSSSFAVGYGNISSTNYYFKGKILAIRVYKTKLTAQQIIYNHNIDKKRFNLA